MKQNETFLASFDQARIICGLLYDTNKLNSGFTNILHVMFSTYKDLLLEETGLLYDISDAVSYRFIIKDTKKFFLLKIKYGF